MKIFVTGGSGFIGKYVVQRLIQDKHEVVLLTRQNKQLNNNWPSKSVHYIYGDLARIDLWKSHVARFKPNATIHLAWEGIPDYGPQNSIKNLQYGLSLFDLLVKMGCKTILTTGSCWEYGDKSGRLSENTFAQPINSFSWAKYSLYCLGEELAKENKIKFIWARLFYVYGQGQKSTSLIPHLITCAQREEKPNIKTPEVKNDFVCVEDAATALVLLLKNPLSHGIYNIGSGKLTSIKKMANIIAQHYNLDWSYPKAKIKPNQTRNFYADISKIKKEIDWIPEIKISDGIMKMIEFQQKISN